MIEQHTIFKHAGHGIEVVERRYKAIDNDARDTRIFEVTITRGDAEETYAYTTPGMFHVQSQDDAAFSHLPLATRTAAYHAMRSRGKQ